MHWLAAPCYLPAHINKLYYQVPLTNIFRIHLSKFLLNIKRSTHKFRFSSSLINTYAKHLRLVIKAGASRSIFQRVKKATCSWILFNFQRLPYLSQEPASLVKTPQSLVKLARKSWCLPLPLTQPELQNHVLDSDVKPGGTFLAHIHSTAAEPHLLRVENPEALLISNQNKPRGLTKCAELKSALAHCTLHNLESGSLI
jgi:hypothetical protein